MSNDNQQLDLIFKSFEYVFFLIIFAMAAALIFLLWNLVTDNRDYKSHEYHDEHLNKLLTSEYNEVLSRYQIEKIHYSCFYSKPTIVVNSKANGRSELLDDNYAEKCKEDYQHVIYLDQKNNIYSGSDYDDRNMTELERFNSNLNFARYLINAVLNHERKINKDKKELKHIKNRIDELLTH